MKKKIISLVLSTLMVCSLAGCGSNSKADDSKDNTDVVTENENDTEEKEEVKEEKNDLKVGMVTDAGTIDDKSFNQGTWEGILKAEEELGIDSNYLKPAGTTENDYIKEITNLYDTDYKFIVTPGFKFETAVYAAQNKYEDAKFVIIDGEPRNADGEGVIADNTVAIYFAEHESGFVAGVAAALELKEGELGFIGGMEIPAVQKFNWGFQQGVAYANENLGTKMSLKEENVVYEGSFDNVAGGTQIAATMYDRGVKAIFTAAGGVGFGAITEAKTRATKGEEVWVIGVDVDQYADGIYEGEKSIILTSATKKIEQASYDMIKAELAGEFPGGEILTFDASNNGVGIPDENPNLSKDTVDKVNDVFKLIQDGEIKVSDKQGDLIK